MSMRRTLAITTRLLAQFRHDRRTLAILFVTPLIVLGLFALLLRTDAPDPKVGVVVAGEGAFGDIIGDALADSDAIDAVDVGSPGDADALLREGELDAYVVLPAAPDDDGVLRPEVVVEGTDQQVGAIVPAALQQAVLTAAADIPTGAPAHGGPRSRPSSSECSARAAARPTRLSSGAPDSVRSLDTTPWRRRAPPRSSSSSSPVTSAAGDRTPRASSTWSGSLPPGR